MIGLTHDPESIPAHRVSCVIVEFIKWHLVGAVVSGPGGTIRDLGRSEPEAEMGATSTGIVPPLVVVVTVSIILVTSLSFILPSVFAKMVSNKIDSIT